MIKADYIFIAALVMFIGAHITTNFLIKYYEDAAKTVGIAEEVAITMEANPIAKFIFRFEAFKYIYSYILVPGILTGLYWFIRNKYNQEIFAIEAYSIAFFMIGFLNFMNDLSLAIGVLLWKDLNNM